MHLVSVIIVRPPTKLHVQLHRGLTRVYYWLRDTADNSLGLRLADHLMFGFTAVCGTTFLCSRLATIAYTSLWCIAIVEHSAAMA